MLINTPQNLATPPPPLDGELRFDELTRKRCADDFGHIVHRMPEGVLLPGSADDVAVRPLAGRERHRRRDVVEYFDYLNRFAAFEVMLRANGQWSFPHPWLMTFIGDSHVEFVVNAELDALNPVADLAFDQLNTAKRKYDPAQILTPGYEIF